MKLLKGSHKAVLMIVAHGKAKVFSGASTNRGAMTHAHSRTTPAPNGARPPLTRFRGERRACATLAFEGAAAAGSLHESRLVALVRRAREILRPDRQGWIVGPAQRVKSQL